VILGSTSTTRYVVSEDNVEKKMIHSIHKNTLQSKSYKQSGKFLLEMSNPIFFGLIRKFIICS